MTFHRAIVQLSPSLLGQALGLHPYTRILGARLDPFMGSDIELILDHISLPVVQEGERAQYVELATHDWGECGHFHEESQLSCVRPFRHDGLHTATHGDPIFEWGDA